MVASRGAPRARGLLRALLALVAESPARGPASGVVSGARRLASTAAASASARSRLRASVAARRSRLGAEPDPGAFRGALWTRVASRGACDAAHAPAAAHDARAPDPAADAAAAPPAPASSPPPLAPPSPPPASSPPASRGVTAAEVRACPLARLPDFIAARADAFDAPAVAVAAARLFPGDDERARNRPASVWTKGDALDAAAASPATRRSLGAAVGALATAFARACPRMPPRELVATLEAFGRAADGSREGGGRVHVPASASAAAAATRALANESLVAAAEARMLAILEARPRASPPAGHGSALRLTRAWADAFGGGRRLPIRRRRAMDPSLLAAATRDVHRATPLLTPAQIAKTLALFAALGRENAPATPRSFVRLKRAAARARAAEGYDPATLAEMLSSCARLFQTTRRRARSRSTNANVLDTSTAPESPEGATHRKPVTFSPDRELVARFARDLARLCDEARRRDERGGGEDFEDFSPSSFERITAAATAGAPPAAPLTPSAAAHMLADLGRVANWGRNSTTWLWTDSLDAVAPTCRFLAAGGNAETLSERAATDALDALGGVFASLDAIARRNPNDPNDPSDIYEASETNPNGSNGSNGSNPNHNPGRFLSLAFEDVAKAADALARRVEAVHEIAADGREDDQYDEDDERRETEFTTTVSEAIPVFGTTSESAASASRLSARALEALADAADAGLVPEGVLERHPATLAAAARRLAREGASAPHHAARALAATARLVGRGSGRGGDGVEPREAGGARVASNARSRSFLPAALVDAFAERGEAALVDGGEFTGDATLDAGARLRSLAALWRDSATLVAATRGDDEAGEEAGGGEAGGGSASRTAASARRRLAAVSARAGAEAMRLAAEDPTRARPVDAAIIARRVAAAVAEAAEAGESSADDIEAVFVDGDDSRSPRDPFRDDASAALGLVAACGALWSASATADAAPAVAALVSLVAAEPASGSAKNPLDSEGASEHEYERSADSAARDFRGIRIDAARRATSALCSAIFGGEGAEAAAAVVAGGRRRLGRGGGAAARLNARELAVASRAVADAVDAVDAAADGGGDDGDGALGVLLLHPTRGAVEGAAAALRAAAARTRAMGTREEEMATATAIARLEAAVARRDEREGEVKSDRDDA